ncbi:hypothetical protein GUJ93_ZPchr0006g41558 [Zizania palustris]|uniref:Uncharacterized protein n=1 Tax=Zizania palustris TaxID=103762 RepID=A0A8J5VHF1_ZIZPA|nr:hypothetical protein GUJ93_ZPchr0006g41558 [Zizania palustris]
MSRRSWRVLHAYYALRDNGRLVGIARRSVHTVVIRGVSETRGAEVRRAMAGVAAMTSMTMMQATPAQGSASVLGTATKYGASNAASETTLPALTVFSFLLLSSKPSQLTANPPSPAGRLPPRPGNVRPGAGRPGGLRPAPPPAPARSATLSRRPPRARPRSAAGPRALGPAPSAPRRRPRLRHPRLPRPRARARRPRSAASPRALGHAQPPAPARSATLRRRPPRARPSSAAGPRALGLAPPPAPAPSATRPDLRPGRALGPAMNKKLAKALKYAVSQMQDISKKLQETASFCYTDEDHVDGTLMTGVARRVDELAEILDQTSLNCQVEVTDPNSLLEAGYCSEDSALRANVFVDEELSQMLEPQTLGEHCAMYDLDFEEMWDRAM